MNKRDILKLFLAALVLAADPLGPPGTGYGQPGGIHSVVREERHDPGNRYLRMAGERMHGAQVA